MDLGNTQSLTPGGGAASSPLSKSKPLPAYLSLSGHQSAKSKSVTWLTPPEIIEAFGPFDTDPCCPPQMPWRTADNMYSCNGLEREWVGFVWMNPPFGRAARQDKWMEKMATHGNGIALIAARTETKMFFSYVWEKATSLLFLRGRPHFYKENGERAPFNSGAPVVLVGYGEEAKRRFEARDDIGKVVNI